MESNNDLRTERNRLKAITDQTARIIRPRPFATPRYLGQVYNGGAMPSSTGKWFLTHPVAIDGAETEGASGTVTADTSTSVPVLVIGSTVPSVGDVLVAHHVGGRWVAERGTAGGTGISFFSCGTCAIPKTSLSCTFDFQSGHCGWSGSLNFGTIGPFHTPAWTSPFFSMTCSGLGTFNCLQIQLTCSSNFPHIIWQQFPNPDCTGTPTLLYQAPFSSTPPSQIYIISCGSSFFIKSGVNDGSSNFFGTDGTNAFIITS